MNQSSRPRLASNRRARRPLYVVALLAVLAVALWVLQERWGIFTLFREKAGSLTSLVGEFSQSRGTIFDRNLKQLAVTLDRVSVFARTQEIKSVPETVKTLGEILSLDEKELQQKLESGTLRVWVAEEISLEQEIAVKSKRLPGIYLQKSEKRFYPNGSQAAHILGYAENGIGLAGIEHFFDKVQASGKHLQAQGDLRLSEQDLVLTLDVKIQELLDAILGETAKDSMFHNGLACLMEMESGAIVAASQLPGFDPNNFAKFSKDILINRMALSTPLPRSFRVLLRDVALLYNESRAEVALLPWSVRAVGDNLGNQVRLWEKLRLSEISQSDFVMAMPTESGGESAARALSLLDSSLEMVPTAAAPLNILAATATLLNGGKAVWPHVAGGELALRASSGAENPRGDGRKGAYDPPIPSEAPHLFTSLAKVGPANSRLFREEVPLVRGVGKQERVHLLELILATIPAGGNDLLLLVAVEKRPQGNTQKNGNKTMILEQLVEERIERISILQEVAKSVADVVEPEAGEDVNFQDKKGDGTESRREGPALARERPRLTIMPDLRGQSLRQSLRMMQGARLRIGIRGTGKIVSQKPAPGTPLQGVSEAVLILDKPEEITPEIMAKRAAAGK